MAQRIAILVALVCLSGSSHSRSWVVFHETDGYESWQANPDDYGLNQKSKHHSGEDSWESDEDSEEDYSGYENGYESDKHILSTNGFCKDHGGHGHDYHNHHQVDGGHHHNYDWGHHGHPVQSGIEQPNHNRGHPPIEHPHSKSDHPGQNWGSERHHHHQNGYTDQLRPHVQQTHTGSPGQSGQDWGVHEHNTQRENLGPHDRNTGPALGLPQNSVMRSQDSGNGADRLVFPDFNNQVSTTRPATTTTAGPTTQPTAGTTTTDWTLLDLVICIRACPTTSEYNPVCGSNNVTYNNPGALQCARNCGLNVAVARQAPCPRAVPQPTTTRPITHTTGTTPTLTQATTARTTTFPAVNPTRTTTINVNSVNEPGLATIPIDILQNVFGNTSPSGTEEPEFDIDKRTKP